MILHNPLTRFHSCVRLALALAANGHAAPTARAPNVASSLEVSTLDHGNAVLSGVTDEVGSRRRASTGDGEEGSKRKSESSQLHGAGE